MTADIGTRRRTTSNSPRKDAAPQLSPGAPFKGNIKRIAESGQRLD